MTLAQDGAAGAAAPLVREALPYAAQYGILGLLCLLLGCSVIYLVWKLDRIRMENAAQLAALRNEHAAELRTIHNERIKEVGQYAKTLAELMGPVQEVVGQIEEIAKAVEDRRRR